MPDLLHATLIRIERASSWDGTAGLSSAVREVCLRVGARLGRWLLYMIYQYVTIPATRGTSVTHSHGFGIGKVFWGTRGFRCGGRRVSLSVLY